MNKHFQLPFLGFLLFLNAAFLQAGVLLTKSQQSQVGNLVESEKSVSLQSEFGAVDFKKENLIWYSIDPSIDTLFKAGQKAKEEGNHDAAIHLFRQSYNQEPATQAQAQSELQVLQVITAKAPTPGENADAPEALSGPEEKIKRGEKLVQMGEDLKKRGEKNNKVFGKDTDYEVKRLGEDFKEENDKFADKKIEEGNRLIEEGKKELEALKVQQEAQAQAAQEMQQQVQEEIKQTEAVKQQRQELLKPIEWSDMDKLVNILTAVFFGLIILYTLWTITVSEKRKK